MHHLIRAEAERQGVQISGVGGLTMGADPVALATAMYSFSAKDASPLSAFIVRKTPKSHGQAKLVEGNFKRGDLVVVVDDVVTRGESTINAIQAVNQEGGKVAFVAVLIDREEGGCQKIEQMGYRVVSAFKRSDLMPQGAKSHHPEDCIAA
jgi:orotate phosphoribosyltransferase